MIEMLMARYQFVEPSLASGLVFRTTKEADLFRSIHEPTDAQEILDSWPRVDGVSYFADPTTATGESADWLYDAVQDSFVQPNNSSNTQAILSPVKLESYVLETTVTSPGGDDDLIGVVLAAEEINGSVNALYAWISPRGVAGDTLSINFFDPTSGGSGEKIAGNAILSNYSNANATDNNGWSGKEVKVRAARSGNTISVKCSDWNGSEILDSTEIIIELNTLPRDGTLLAGSPSRYGFATQSQANSTYLGYTIRSGEIEDDTRVYSEADNLRWIYLEGSWTQNGTAYQDFADVDRVSNRLTKELFDINTSTLQFRDNNGVSYGNTTLTLPPSTASTVPMADIISNYTFDETISIVGVFDPVNLTASIADSTSLTVTTTASDGEFYVMLSTDTVVDPDTQIEERTIAFRRVIVTV